MNLVFSALDLTLTNVWRTWAIFDRRLSDLSHLWPTSGGLELSLTDVCRTWAIFDRRLSDLSYLWLDVCRTWAIWTVGVPPPPRPTATKKDFILFFSIGIRIPPKRMEQIYRIKWISPPSPPEKSSSINPHQNITFLYPNSTHKVRRVFSSHAQQLHDLVDPLAFAGAFQTLRRCVEIYLMRKAF